MPRCSLLLVVVVALFAAPAYAQDVLEQLIAPDAEAPVADAGSIDANAGASEDRAIEQRLGGIFGELEPLNRIEVESANGVVTLSGTAGSTAAAERAEALAGSVEGVVDVVDAMEVDANVRRRLEATLDRLRDGFLSSVAALPLLLIALATLALFWWLSGWLTHNRSVFSRLAPNAFIAELLAGVVRLLIIVAGVILALSLLDATSIIGTVLGAAGIVGLAIGFAVRDTVENYIASILLSLRTPFLARDLVRIGEHEGHVARLTGRATILISIDGNHIRIPNATVFKSTIVNFSRNPERRFEFAVGVDADLDPGEARQLALATLGEIDGLLQEPPPSVVVTELGDSNVSLTAYAWIDQRATDLLKARGEAIRRVKQAFDGAGIVMPEPIYRLRVDARGDPLPIAGGGGTGGGAGGGSGDTSSRDGSGGTKKGSDDRAQAAGATTARQGAGVPSGAQEAGGARDESRDSDTSADHSVSVTLEREVAAADGENLLDESTRPE